MPIATLKLKANAKPRVLAGHPWVFGNEVEVPLPPEHDGEVVECRDRTGRFIGSGIYNSKSQIVWRRLSRDRVELNELFLRQALAGAIGRRKVGSGLPNCCRLVWSESDDLPGIVVDKFGNALVLQIQTLAMEKRGGLIADLLAEFTGVRDVVFRNDANIRRLEGLPLEVHTRSGKPLEPGWVSIDGVEYWLDLIGGQKTGFYLDQRPQHSAVAKYCAGGRVLDAFCNQGAFALHAGKAGAKRILGLDSAEDAVVSARKNAERNRVTAEFSVANVFDWFNDSARSADSGWDVIVLDPPPFAKSKGSLEGALRGYKEINLRAMKLLSPGGVLATFSCSHHMHDAELREVIASAAVDARRKVQILEFCHQPADHPVLVTMPESEYLRGFILRIA